MQVLGRLPLIKHFCLQALDTVEAEVEGLAACCNRWEIYILGIVELLGPLHKPVTHRYSDWKLLEFIVGSGRRRCSTELQERSLGLEKPCVFQDCCGPPGVQLSNGGHGGGHRAPQAGAGEQPPAAGAGQQLPAKLPADAGRGQSFVSFASLRWWRMLRKVSRYEEESE